ncbi:MAG TPA: hypothetical protein VMW50_12955 [Dehalococcoidia bacterium]|nr:hypothetical protein [Dehalococcoidia bacterium]
MSVNKYIQSARLISLALEKINPQKDPVLWDILQALKSLIVEFQADTAHIEARLAELEAAQQKNA